MTFSSKKPLFVGIQDEKQPLRCRWDFVLSKEVGKLSADAIVEELKKSFSGKLRKNIDVVRVDQLKEKLRIPLAELLEKAGNPKEGIVLLSLVRSQWGVRILRIYPEGSTHKAIPNYGKGVVDVRWTEDLYLAEGYGQFTRVSGGQKP